MSSTNRYFKAIVIGVSAGGLDVLMKIIPELPPDFTLPIVIVQHVQEGSDFRLPEILQNKSLIKIKEARDMEELNPSHVYIAPPGYHLLIENEKQFRLSIDAPVQYARPSIDVLFESAADVYQNKLIGIILTGANSDGSDGLRSIKQSGGMAIVQDPVTAEVDSMPRAAIDLTEIDHILKPEEIAPFLIQASQSNQL